MSASTCIHCGEPLARSSKKYFWHHQRTNNILCPDLKDFAQTQTYRVRVVWTDEREERAYVIKSAASQAEAVREARRKAERSRPNHIIHGHEVSEA